MPMSDAQIKDVFKQAFIEVLQENREELYDLFAEVLEDMALTNAIREGASTEYVSRAEVFEVLESGV
ncbi:MAG: hypothetical protein B6I38_04615 [Anaerolineaceae bacterium 4572_5.1]|nr:MAG: hypothetical protein B6I38_04615 [Anaerolineaceae bacterium 4572_5.1]